MLSKKLVFSWLFCLFVLAVSLNPSIAIAQWSAPTAEQVYADADRTQSCPNCNHRLPQLDVYGWRGNPHFGDEQGGCRCGKKAGLTWYNGYHHWPNPWSALLDHGRNGCRNNKSADTRHPRLRDRLEAFADFRLMPPIRCDNGHTGKYCDPYGLLGESRRGRTLDYVPEQRPAPGDYSNSVPPRAPLASQRPPLKEQLVLFRPAVLQPTEILTSRYPKLASEKHWVQDGSMSRVSNPTRAIERVAKRMPGDVSLPSSRGPGPSRLR